MADGSRNQYDDRVAVVVALSLPSSTWTPLSKTFLNIIITLFCQLFKMFHSQTDLRKVHEI